MKKDGDVVGYTVAELVAMRARGEDRTDWARLDAMKEEELEAAIASDPDWADIPHDWYEHATPHYPESMRKQVSLRIDPDILAWFKRQGLSRADQWRAARLRRSAEASRCGVIPAGARRAASAVAEADSRGGASGLS